MASNSLSNLLELSRALTGSRTTGTTQTSGGTSTTTQQIKMDQEGMDRMIRQMMGGQGGQASISGAARGAGMYDSTTERQMLNDLNTRVAGEVAMRTAPKVTEQTTSPTTSTTTSETPGIGLGNMAALLGATAIGKPVLEGLTGLITGSGGGATPLSLAAGPGLLSSGAATMDFQTPGFITGGGAGLTGSLGNTMDELASMPFEAMGIGGSMAPALGGLESLVSSVPIASFANMFANPDQVNLGQFGLSAMAPMIAGLGPIGAAIAPLMPLVGSLLGGISTVCTALTDKGLLDKELYAAGHSYTAALPRRTIKGYYFWGLPLAAKIRAGSPLATAFALPFAKQRTALLAGHSAWRNPLGVLTKYLGEPACYALGYILDKLENYNGDKLSPAARECGAAR